MQDGLKDPRWPLLAAAVHEWSESCLKALEMAKTLRLSVQAGDNQTTVDLSRVDDQKVSASMPVRSLSPPEK